jgi:regulatory protein
VKAVDTITSIILGKGRSRQARIYINGEYALSLDIDVMVKEMLQIGQELSPEKIASLGKSEKSYLCRNAAYRFLDYRPRSESETRELLEQKGFDRHNIDITLAELKRQGLLNDVTFARFWKDNRNSFRPRSQKMLKMELKNKGVDSGIIKEVTGEIDDYDSASRAALEKARTLSLSDYRVFRNRLGGYLYRRGFNYQIINKVVKQVWEDRQNNQIKN